MHARLCLCLLATACLAIGADTAAAIRIARIRSHMSENLARLPNYTCTQTIERSVRPARSRRFRLVDTLRLEVALVDGKELFAWPGSGKFDDREISDLIGSGASGNGNFGLHARAIFLGGGSRFDYLGEVETEERRVFRYGFRVPQAFSGFKVKIGAAAGIAGYYGYFEAETESLDVVSLDVLADEEIPPHVPIRRSATRMRYQRMKIGESDFLLPESSELSIIDNNGDEARNFVHLNGCKQYGTESVISFADPPPATELPPAPPATAATTHQIGELPIGLSFEVELDTTLTFPGAAIGDLLEGHLASDAKKKGAVMIPRGTAIRGRLLKFGPLPARVPAIGIMLRLDEIELPGGRAQVYGIPERILPVGVSGARLSVDNGMIIIVGGVKHQLVRGSRIWWRLEQQQQQTEKR